MSAKKYESFLPVDKVTVFNNNQQLICWATLYLHRT